VLISANDSGLIAMELLAAELIDMHLMHEAVQVESGIPMCNSSDIFRHGKAYG